MRLYSVRGASSLDDDSREEMRQVVIGLMESIMEKNAIDEGNVVNIVFSQTNDIVASNPARELRSRGFANVPLFCTQEPQYPNSLSRVVRVMVTFYGPDDFTPLPVYQGKASQLRPDLAE